MQSQVLPLLGHAELKGQAARSPDYAFTDWKGVDWDALYSRFAPRIAAARQAYYLAPHEYLCSIRARRRSLEAQRAP